MDDKFEAVDRISVLPPFIIHQIMSYLSAEEATQTCVLSKKWYHFWESYPYLDFDQSIFVSGMGWQSPKMSSLMQHEDFSASIGYFTELVDQSLQRFCKLKLRMQRFTLDMTIPSVEYHSTVDKWIHQAIESGVKELSLWIKTDGDEIYTLPPAVLSAGCISNLIVHGCSLMQPLAKHNLQLPFLENLTLQHGHVCEEMVQKITSNCPFLEKFVVFGCWGLKSFVVSKHAKLKTIHLQVDDLGSIKIDAPSLQLLHLSFGSISPITISMVSCTNLRTLHLVNVRIPDQEFHCLMSMFPLLEHLIVFSCASLRRIKVSSARLKKVSLVNNIGLEAIEIDAANLLNFELRSRDVPPTCSINVPCKWVVHFDYNDAYGTLWYLKVKEFLGNTNEIAKLSLSIVTNQDPPTLAELRESSSSLPVELGNLHLHVASPASNYAALLECLLWLCYPKTLAVVTRPVPGLQFYKFFYDELRKRDLNCCSSSHTKCWRHYLKSMHAEDLKRNVTYEQPFSLDALMDPEAIHPWEPIYFSLEWYPYLPSNTA